MVLPRAAILIINNLCLQGVETMLEDMVNQDPEWARQFNQWHCIQAGCGDHAGGHGEEGPRVVLPSAAILIIKLIINSLYTQGVETMLEDMVKKDPGWAHHADPWHCVYAKGPRVGAPYQSTAL